MPAHITSGMCSTPGLDTPGSGAHHLLQESPERVPPALPKNTSLIFALDEASAAQSRGLSRGMSVAGVGIGPGRCTSRCLGDRRSLVWGRSSSVAKGSTSPHISACHLDLPETMQMDLVPDGRSEEGVAELLQELQRFLLPASTVEYK